MQKPRVVIVDDDFSYIVPLQSKFIREFFDEVELEVVTDPEYYAEMFRSPQKMDILIVDKKLYMGDQDKHVINYVFIMSEDQDDDIRPHENVHVLYKYTNVKGIFLEIVGKSGLKIPTKESKNIPQIVLVTSACGGCGKTTVALGIASALSEMYKRVLYVEASHLQTFQFFLEESEPIKKQNIYAKLLHPERNIYRDIKSEFRVQSFTYMPPMETSLMAYGIDYSVYGMIAKSAKLSGDFDFIIIDADVTFDDSKAKMMSVADRVLLVTEQTPQAVYATERLVANINNIETDKYLFVCNKYSKEKENVFMTKGSLNFKIDEYVDEFDCYNNMSCAEFEKEETIRKIAFLLI